MPLRPHRLASEVKEKKEWGSPHTAPWHRNPDGRNIGEIWFAASDSVPLLVKLLFTRDNLSVQVHPADAYARQHHDSRGKTEMWHILRAEPNAQVALGLRTKLTAEQLREAALNGKIMEHLNWIPARAGDTFFVPAGTIHAIGGGLTLCEVQQLSDITYRLYDYGRPRELHLDHAVAVSHLEPQLSDRRRDLPVDCPYFHTERLEINGTWISEPPDRNTLYIALEGQGSIGGEPFQAGEAWEIPAGTPPFEITSAHAIFLITAEPSAKA
jgi:mannose-6-phosphate isomerase